MRQVRRYGRRAVLVLWLGVVGLLFASGCSKNVVGPEQRTQAEPNTQQTKPYGPPYIWDQD